MSRVIKKYTNQRYYDTISSNYVSLRYLKELVMNDEDVVIMECGPNGNEIKDITQDILMRFATETMLSGASLEALKKIVRDHGTVGRMLLSHGTSQLRSALEADERVYNA